MWGGVGAPAGGRAVLAGGGRGQAARVNGCQQDAERFMLLCEFCRWRRREPDQISKPGPAVPQGKAAGFPTPLVSPAPSRARLPLAPRLCSARSLSFTVRSASAQDPARYRAASTHKPQPPNVPGVTDGSGFGPRVPCIPPTPSHTD
ncbi:metalloproteinase inhibitor 1 [Platysternon megacephalum]|uniref:Metalloproteinase inhibitor 1 n=1 Tax=Platysternon megacephalum TaxID=55544 RepID=A0A4D9DLI5_9SAUR|nr:metalloproteinase inhibitor 1 [Platysternon megacephalum]